jgi:signal transduction histidine kinase
MKLDPGDYDFLSNFSTMGAIVLGSVLATVGALAATQIEWRFEKRRREQHAALFFGEVLATLLVLLGIAKRVKGIGDPYGPVTMRMLRQALQEIGIYDRNRENLYNLSNAALRARIHTLVLRVSSPLNGIFDTTEEIRAVQTRLRSADVSENEREEIGPRIAQLTEMREGAFEFMEETAREIEALVKDLEPVAGHSFVDIAAAAARPNPVAAPGEVRP